VLNGVLCVDDPLREAGTRDGDDQAGGEETEREANAGASKCQDDTSRYCSSGARMGVTDWPKCEWVAG
jgi:hypothetical protein